MSGGLGDVLALSEALAAKSVEDVVPGSVAMLDLLAQRLAHVAAKLHQGAEGFTGLDEDHWSGQAAEEFRAVYAPQPQKWRTTAEKFASASQAVSSYATDLCTAQADAGRALALLRRGVAISAQAKADHDAMVARLRAHAQVHTALGIPVVVHEPAFVDPGQPLVSEAMAALGKAKSQVASSAAVAAATVRAATEGAPVAPHKGFFSSVTSAVAGAFESTAVSVARIGMNDVINPTVNALYQTGRAIVDDPYGDAELAAGAGMMLLGGVGDLAGGALDATGIGATAGALVGAASTGLIVGGAGLSVTGATPLGQTAADEPNTMHNIGDNHAAGKTAEERVPGPQNHGRIESLSGKKRFRVPDRLNKTLKTIGEIKNVKKLYLSSQLRDLLAYADKYGYDFTLWVRPDAEFTPQLQLRSTLAGSP